MPSPAKIFLDTEFTDLSPIGSMNPPKLISIGAVVLDEDRLFYAEASDTWRQADCSEWVCENVLPLLQGGGALSDKSRIASDFKGWIESFNGPASLFASSEYDIHFVMDLFAAAEIPLNLLSVGVVDWPDFPAIGRSAAIQAEGQYFSLRGGQHNALCDALAYREGWRAGRALMFNDPVGRAFWTRSDCETT